MLLLLLPQRPEGKQAMGARTRRFAVGVTMERPIVVAHAPRPLSLCPFDSCMRAVNDFFRSKPLERSMRARAACVWRYACARVDESSGSTARSRCRRIGRKWECQTMRPLRINLKSVVGIDRSAGRINPDQSKGSSGSIPPSPSANPVLSLCVHTCTWHSIRQRPGIFTVLVKSIPRHAFFKFPGSKQAIDPSTEI